MAWRKGSWIFRYGLSTTLDWLFRLLEDESFRRRWRFRLILTSISNRWSLPNSVVYFTDFCSLLFFSGLVNLAISSVTFWWLLLLVSWAPFLVEVALLSGYGPMGAPAEEDRLQLTWCLLEEGSGGSCSAAAVTASSSLYVSLKVLWVLSLDIWSFFYFF